MTRKTRSYTIAILAITLPFVTASSASALPFPKTDDLNSLGTAESNQENSESLSAEVHVAERSDSSILSVTWSVENNGSNSVAFDWPSGTSYMYNNSLHYSGVTATSPSEGMRFHPIMDSNGECLCSGDTSFDFKGQINPGEQVAYWSMFSVPDEVESIDLEIPGFEVIEDIPVS